MILSIADSKPREQESTRVKGLFPPTLAENASALIGFLEEYYKYLNTVGLPSNAIANITAEHDIDRVSLNYIDAIQQEIAQGVPNSKVLDRVSLYKKIVKYYSIRGTSESAVTFFRIFFDEFAEIIYPKEQLFKLSAGSGFFTPEGQWAYSDRKGFASDANKLHDGVYWQDYSYVIKSGIPVDEWEKSYLKLVHPAGLYMFARLLVLVEASNIWDNSIDYGSLDPQLDLTWLDAYVPPSKFDVNSRAYHTPKYQPGWLAGNYKKIRFLIQTLVSADDTLFVRAVYNIIKSIIENDEGRDAIVRKEYQHDIKFLDSSLLSEGLSEITIADALAPLTDLNKSQFSAIAAIRTYSKPWENSSCIYEEASTSVTPAGVVTYYPPDNTWNLVEFDYYGIPTVSNWTPGELYFMP